MDSNEQTTNAAGSTSPESTETGADPTGVQEPSAEQRTAQKERVTDEIFSELTVLANRFVEAAQQAWNSEERKRMEADLKKGLNDVAVGLEEGFQKVTENEKAQRVLNRADQTAEEVGDKLRSSQAVNDIAQGLVRGLRSMAAILEGWSEEMTARDAARKAQTEEPPAQDDEAQDIPVDRA